MKYRKLKLNLKVIWIFFIVHIYLFDYSVIYVSVMLYSYRIINSDVDTAQKWSFTLRISSVNVTKSAGNYRFGHIYWRNP